MSVLSRHTALRRGQPLVRASDAAPHPGGRAAGPGTPAQPADQGTAHRDGDAAAGDSAVLAESLRTPERFGEIYRAHFGEIYRYVAGRLGPEAADDLAAETFLAAFRRRHSFSAARGAVRPWLYGIATNVVAEHLRVETRRLRALAMLSAEAACDGPEERIAERLSAQSLRAPLASALAGLSARDRDVLLLVALGDLSYDEIAFALSIPKGTVGSRLNRARRKLTRALNGAARPRPRDEGTGPQVSGGFQAMGSGGSPPGQQSAPPGQQSMHPAGTGTAPGGEGGSDATQR